MPASLPPLSLLARRLRTTLGLNQAELGWLLGVGERTVLRLEAGEAAALDPVLGRLLWAVGETRLEDAEGALRQLLLEADGRPAGVDREETFARALSRLRALGASPALRLKDARVSRWVYWATGARADAQETLALARDEGVICRPLGPTLPGYVAQLQPGDRVLLCHNGEPLGWFELEQIEEMLPVATPPVFRLVAATSRLGKRLARDNYPLWNGRAPRGHETERFSALAVRAVREPLRTPAPRGRGIRDTMTPLVPA